MASVKKNAWLVHAPSLAEDRWYPLLEDFLLDLEVRPRLYPVHEVLRIPRHMRHIVASVASTSVVRSHVTTCLSCSPVLCTCHGKGAAIAVTIPSILSPFYVPFGASLG
jgi:hypothetical protein